ncbi:MAG TPA: outer membrane protein transport protein [Bacteroidales bacterium]|nr:outer membrane protein transport protein [Bacteroidales bacterium]
MKRSLVVLLAVFLTANFSFGGGIVTNTNQSAMFTRLQARDATLGPDAVYYNPAGLVFLSTGFHFSINNQTLGQTRTVTNSYPNLNDDTYKGDVFAPVFPGIYASYNTGKFAFSLGFNPIGGGGGATYENGLPSFEMSQSDLTKLLAGAGVTDYSMDAYFKGSSVYFGYQGNISYKISDQLSVAIGGRYVSAKETYQGHLRDIEVNAGGTWGRADAFILNKIVPLASGAADQMQPLIDGGAGPLTFQQAEDMSVITTGQRAQMEGGLQSFGVSTDGMTLREAQAAYTGVATKYTASAQLLGDQEADVEKTATGFTPIISVDFHPSEKLNIALKYEHRTKLEFTNNTKKDLLTGFDSITGEAITQFPDGAKTHLDIPSQLVAGVTFKPVDKLLLSAGFHYYLDKNANWDGKEKKLDGNSFEFGIGGEYSLTDMFGVSAGYLYTKSGATGSYQTDMSYSLPSSTVGLGGVLHLNEMLELNLGASYTMYQEGSRIGTHDLGEIPISYTETYDKDVWIVAVGLNIAL